jgi:hypothetical protein
VNNIPIREAYDVVGVILDTRKNVFRPVYPQNSTIIPSTDQQRVVMKRLGRYKTDIDEDFIRDFLTYVKKHFWGVDARVMLSYVAVSPILYSVSDFDVRPDLIVYGPHGTAKTRTAEIIVGSMYGAIVETGEFITSISRFGDLLSATTLPVIIDEVEKVADSDTFTILKSRTTGDVDFVRKLPDQRQIRIRFRAPIIVVTNTNHIVRDINYLRGRTLLIDTSNVKRVKRAPKVYKKLRASMKIFGIDMWEFLSTRFTYNDLMELYYKYLESYSKDDFADVRRPSIYSILRLGATLINTYLKERWDMKNIVTNNHIRTFIDREELILEKMAE